MTYVFRSLTLLALIMMAGCQTGCRDEGPYKLDPSFSLNIARPDFTEEYIEEMTTIENEIFDRYGPPDYVRILWNPNGKIVTRASHIIAAKYHEDAQRPRTWVYTDRDVEVEFKAGAASYEIRELADNVRVICELGDPQDVGQRVISPSRPPDVVWTYYRDGRRYIFDEDGNQKRVEYFGGF